MSRRGPEIEVPEDLLDRPGLLDEKAPADEGVDYKVKSKAVGAPK